MTAKNTNLMVQNRCWCIFINANNTDFMALIKNVLFMLS